MGFKSEPRLSNLWSYTVKIIAKIIAKIISHTISKNLKPKKLNWGKYLFMGSITLAFGLFITKVEAQTNPVGFDYVLYTQKGIQQKNLAIIHSDDSLPRKIAINSNEVVKAYPQYITSLQANGEFSLYDLSGNKMLSEINVSKYTIDNNTLILATVKNQIEIFIYDAQDQRTKWKSIATLGGVDLFTINHDLIAVRNLAHKNLDFYTIENQKLNLIHINTWSDQLGIESYQISDNFLMLQYQNETYRLFHRNGQELFSSRMKPDLMLLSDFYSAVAIQGKAKIFYAAGNSAGYSINRVQDIKLNGSLLVVQTDDSLYVLNNKGENQTIKYKRVMHTWISGNILGILINAGSQIKFMDENFKELGTFNYVQNGLVAFNSNFICLQNSMQSFNCTQIQSQKVFQKFFDTDAELSLFQNRLALWSPNRQRIEVLDQLGRQVINDVNVTDVIKMQSYEDDHWKWIEHELRLNAIKNQDPLFQGYHHTPITKNSAARSRSRVIKQPSSRVPNSKTPLREKN